MLSGVRLRLRTSRAAFRSESFFSGDPPDSGAGLGVSTSSSASDGISASTASVSGSVAGVASGAPGSAMTRSILVTIAADLLDFPAVRGDLGYDNLDLIASDFHHDDGSDCDVARVAHTYLLLVV